jgi:hypothetical protein
MVGLEPGDEALVLAFADLRKRTKARILWMSRPTAFSIASSRRTSGSEAISKSFGSS